MRKSKKSKKMQQGELDSLSAKPLNPLTTLTSNRKRGRRTTADNFLLGARNGWLSFFEKTWHEIGWQLLQIRMRGMGTMEEVRKIFEPVRGKPEFHCADSFLRAAPQAGEGKERRANVKRAVALQREIHKMRSQQQELESTCVYAEIAVKQAGENERAIIEADASQKQKRLRDVKDKLLIAENESNELERQVREQETHLYCSELLGFLCTGKYAVKPLPLANSLAGLPQMGWRQSLARCSKMPPTFSQVQYPYGILRAILRIWKLRAKRPELSIVDLFHEEIPELRKQDREARTYLSEGWRDLRMAIDQCSREEQSDDFMPYAITRVFVNNQSRPKNQAERILAERERLAHVT
ncbi:MAG TPA: hypothetical protein VKB26_04745 [Candidatus Acidoferrales bacterium]|nr:hypothetical protein [Candidatus Acidoferrales bacterium]